MKREPLRRGEKWLAGGAVVLFAGLVGGPLWLRSINAEPKVTYPPREAAPSPNGFDLFVGAARGFKADKRTDQRSGERWVGVDPVLDSGYFTDPKLRAQSYSLVRRGAWLKANRRNFALFRHALALPCRTSGEYADLHFDNSRAYEDLCELADYTTTETRTLKLRGDWNGAAQSGLDTVQMGIDLPRGGGLYVKFVAESCAIKGRNSLEKVPDHLNARQARAAARRLEALIDRRVSFAEAMRVEKWAHVASFLVMVRHSEAEHMPWRSYAASNALSGSSPREWLYCMTVSKTNAVQLIERFADEELADLATPYSAPMDVEIEESGPGSEPLEKESDHDPFPGWAYKYGTLRFNEASEQTGLEMLLLRLALRAYELEKRGPPHTLDALVPAYLKAVPRDRFGDGAPLHFRTAGKKYTLWSIGPDLKNDNGTPAPYETPDSMVLIPRLLRVEVDSKGDWVAGKNR